MLGRDVNVDDRTRFELEEVQTPVAELWLRDCIGLSEGEQADALMRVDWCVHA